MATTWARKTLLTVLVMMCFAGLYWIARSFVEPSISLSFVAYEQRRGDGRYYARLLLRNSSDATIWYLETIHLENVDALGGRLVTVPVICRIRTGSGWGPKNQDQTSVGDMGGDQHLSPGGRTTFLVPVESGAAPKRVGLQYSGGETNDRIQAMIRTWFRKVRITLKHPVERPTAWCSEVLVIPSPRLKTTSPDI